MLRSSFWKRSGYVPLYVRQTASELTGEHTCVMVRGLNSSTEGELEWLTEFTKGKLALELDTGSFTHWAIYTFRIRLPAPVLVPPVLQVPGIC